VVPDLQPGVRNLPQASSGQGAHCAGQAALQQLPVGVGSDAVELDPARVKALNQQLRLTSLTLPGKDDPNHKYGFSCECGCGRIVPPKLSRARPRRRSLGRRTQASAAAGVVSRPLCPPFDGFWLASVCYLQTEQTYGEGLFESPKEPVGVARAAFAPAHVR
jgi:hypothetical protein